MGETETLLLSVREHAGKRDCGSLFHVVDILPHAVILVLISLKESVQQHVLILPRHRSGILF